MGILHLGNVPASSTLYIPFETVDGTGAGVTMSGLAVTDIEIYKNGSVTQRASDSGYALLDTDGIDFDSVTGLHGFSVDLSDNTDASFYAVGSFYWVLVNAITVTGATVSPLVATFRIVAAEAVAGKPKVDVDAWLGTAAATPTTAGVPEVDVTFWLGTAAATPSVAGVPEVDVTHWIGTAAATPTTAGVPEVDVTFWRGEAVPATSQTGVPEVDLTYIAGVLVSTTTAQLGTNVVQISADSTAADNLETAFDDTAGAVRWHGIVDQGTAQSATGTTLVLRAAAAFADDELNGCFIVITGGTTGVGQVRQITDYVSSTDTATVATWTTTPTGTITYKIFYGVAALNVNVTQVSGDATAADTLELFVEALDQTTGQLDSGSYAAGAIDAAAIAADAIGSSELAGSAATEIANAVIAAIEAAGESSSAAISYSSDDVDVANLALDILREAPITSFTDGTPEANWLARNYATARDAELREHPWRFALKRKKILPLDYLMTGISGTLSGAWATFKVTENYSGDIVTIRRSSDSTTDDFTVADASLTVDTEAIATFVGTGTGYVSSFFDQSGNARTLAQATTTKQPEFDAELTDADGATVANGMPAAAFDGSNDILATSGALSDLISVSTGYIVIAGLIDALTLDSATADANHLLIGDASTKIGLYARLGGTLYGMNADSGGDDSITDNVPTLVPFVAEIRHASGTLYTRVNLTTEKSTTSGDTTSLAGALNVGDLAAGSQATNFNLFAVLTFSTVPTEAERVLLVERLMRTVDAGGLANFGWSYRYQVPEDCLRMLAIRTDGDFDGDPVKHEIEKGYILTNKSTAVYTRYIQQFTDAAKFDPLFTEALSAKLAFKMSHWLTGKASMTNTTKALYDDAIVRAKRANCFEGTPESQYGQDVINARYTT